MTAETAETAPDIWSAVDRLRQLVRGETEMLPDDPSTSPEALHALQQEVAMGRRHPRLRVVVVEALELAVRASRLREAGLDGEHWSFAELVGAVRVLEAMIRPLAGE